MEYWSGGALEYWKTIGDLLILHYSITPILQHSC